MSDKSCSNCGDPVGRKGAKGRCPKCASYWRTHGSERPENYTNPRYHTCPWTQHELYTLYWREMHGADAIAQMVAPPVTPKVIYRWLREYTIPIRSVDQAARITAKRHGPELARSMRAKLAQMRLSGFVTSDASQMHTPEVRAKVVAANKARVKRAVKGVSRSYAELLAGLSERQREKVLSGKSGFNRLRALSKL